MRKLLLALLVLAAIPVVLFLIWDTQTRTLAHSLTADLTAVKARVIRRDPPPKVPLHDNGYQCLGAMLDVTPSDLGPFSPKNLASLEPFITGAKPISELSAEVRASMVSLSPWANSMRSCGDSHQLAWVEGVSLWAAANNLRWVRLTEVMPSLIEFTALELRVLLADGQPEVVLERCGATWAMVADQSHLGQGGAMNARTAVRRLAPACGAALAAVPAEVKTQVAGQWAPLRNRLAPAKEIIEAERLGNSLRTFAWVADDASRAQLPGVVVPAMTSFSSKLSTGRTWRSWDAAMRELVAAAEGPERAATAARVEAIAPSQYLKFLSSYEEAFVLLDVLADLAAGGSKPLPAGVTKKEKALEYVSPQAQTLLIPTN